MTNNLATHEAVSVTLNGPLFQTAGQLATMVQQNGHYVGLFFRGDIMSQLYVVEWDIPPVGPLPLTCPFCEEQSDSIAIRRSNTAYVVEHNNWETSCQTCFDEHEEYWEEKWREYRGMAGVG